MRLAEIRDFHTAETKASFRDLRTRQDKHMTALGEHRRIAKELDETPAEQIEDTTKFLERAAANKAGKFRLLQEDIRLQEEHLELIESALPQHQDACRIAHDAHKAAEDEVKRFFVDDLGYDPKSLIPHYWIHHPKVIEAYQAHRQLGARGYEFRHELRKHVDALKDQLTDLKAEAIGRR